LIDQEAMAQQFNVRQAERIMKDWSLRKKDATNPHGEDHSVFMHCPLKSKDSYAVTRNAAGGRAAQVTRTLMIEK